MKSILKAIVAMQQTKTVTLWVHAVVLPMPVIVVTNKHGKFLSYGKDRRIQILTYAI